MQASNNWIHLLPSKSATLCANSEARCNNMTGTKQKSFQALDSDTTSPANLALHLPHSELLRNIEPTTHGSWASLQHRHSTQHPIVQFDCVQLCPPLIRQLMLLSQPASSRQRGRNRVGRPFFGPHAMSHERNTFPTMPLDHRTCTPPRSRILAPLLGCGCLAESLRNPGLETTGRDPVDWIFSKTS